MVDALSGLSGKLAPANNTKANAPAVGRAAAGTESSKSDTTSMVDLSNEATLALQKSLSKEPPFNEGKVARIKEAIRDGKYPVDIDKIADSLMEYHVSMR